MSRANKKAPGADDAEGHDDYANGSKVVENREKASTGARAARDLALDRITLRADPAWLAEAEAALLAAIDRESPACVDDCRGSIPPPSMPCWWCIVPRMLCARGIIRRVGSRPGRATVTHGGDLRLWARVEAKR